jgi:hypothetical protein
VARHSGLEVPLQPVAALQLPTDPRFPTTSPPKTPPRAGLINESSNEGSSVLHGTLAAANLLAIITKRKSSVYVHALPFSIELRSSFRLPQSFRRASICGIFRPVL